MQCPKCGSTSSSGAFCTNCGTSFGPTPQASPFGPTAAAPYQAPPAFGYAPTPPPPAPVAPMSPYPMVPVGPMGMMPFRCGVCGFTGQPMMIQKISTAGWITFGLLLAFCLPLFWIGLLIKENRCQCPNCMSTY